MKIEIKPKKDYNKKDYWNPVGFMLIIEDDDVTILEALKIKVEELIYQ